MYTVELPFTNEQFLEVFGSYNTAIWPAQVIAYALGIGATALAFRRRAYTDPLIAAALSAFWIWMGIAYHLTFFARINPAAYAFAVLFVLQGILLAYAGLLRKRLVFTFRRDPYGVSGALLILYALLIYPLLGSILGHTYPEAPVFGVAPCPAAIFTFGMLLWTKERVPPWLLVIPVLWSLIGFSAALTLGMFEDSGLLVAGVGGTLLLLYRDRRGKLRLATT